MISRNTNTDENILPQEHTDGISLICEFIKPAIYIPVPRTLFCETGLLNPEFYNNSLNVIGVEPDWGCSSRRITKNI